MTQAESLIVQLLLDIRQLICIAIGLALAYLFARKWLILFALLFAALPPAHAQETVFIGNSVTVNQGQANNGQPWSINGEVRQESRFLLPWSVTQFPETSPGWYLWETTSPDMNDVRLAADDSLTDPFNYYLTKRPPPNTEYELDPIFKGFNPETMETYSVFKDPKDKTSVFRNNMDDLSVFKHGGGASVFSLRAREPDPINPLYREEVRSVFIGRSPQDMNTIRSVFWKPYQIERDPGIWQDQGESVFYQTALDSQNAANNPASVFEGTNGYGLGAMLESVIAMTNGTHYIKTASPIVLEVPTDPNPTVPSGETVNDQVVQGTSEAQADLEKSQGIETTTKANTEALIAKVSNPNAFPFAKIFLPTSIPDVPQITIPFHLLNNAWADVAAPSQYTPQLEFARLIIRTGIGILLVCWFIVFCYHQVNV